MALAANAEKLNLSVYLGIVGTYATVSITQLEGSLEAGTLREVHFDNSAFGLGPGLLLSFKLIDGDNLALRLNGSGHFVVYNKRFPAGGDYYNFMWRFGPAIDYALGDSRSISLSYQWRMCRMGRDLHPRIRPMTPEAWR